MHTYILPLLLALGASNGEPADVVVVCPPAYREAAQPWIDRRTKQGHVIECLSNSGTAEDIQRQIRDLAKNGKLRFVLLIGDARLPDLKTPDFDGPSTNKPSAEIKEINQAELTPTFRLSTKINRYWGGDPEMASDNPYGDLDDDGIPDLAVGRLTAHSSEELTAIFKKIFAYEDSHDFSAWRNRINFVAGEGGYGALTDGAIETFARKIITKGIPAAYQLSMTSAVWKSPYCPFPTGFHDCCLDRMNEGCLFWVFMGHGAPTTLQWAQFPNGSTPILRRDDCKDLHCGSPPIALLFCCYAGAFANDKDCLAESLLGAPGGPVAIFSGSNVTMPYGMGSMAWEAINGYFVNHRATLGELVLNAKRDTMSGYDSPLWALASAVVSSAAPASVNPKAERLEHLQLFNLFGDPTMPLRYPQEATIDLPKTATPGTTIEVSGTCRVSGKATVELVVPLDQIKNPTREKYQFNNRGKEQFDATYKAANNSRLTSASCEARDGHFYAQLELPENLPERCVVRVSVEGAEDYALAAVPLKISPAGTP
jgi:hypothetical protein